MALTHTRTRKFVTPAGHPNSDINMTPLVDVVLVLLIIFMVLTPLLVDRRHFRRWRGEHQ